MLDHLDDIASDMSVFHRVDDITALDGPTFLRFAWRLPAYEGVLRARAVAEENASRPPTPASVTTAGPAQEVNPGTRATLQADPAFQGIFSFS